MSTPPQTPPPAPANPAAAPGAARSPDCNDLQAAGSISNLVGRRGIGKGLQRSSFDELVIGGNPSLTLAAYAGQPCWIGLDLASKVDIAALVLVFTHLEIDGAYAVFGRYYLPEDTVHANGNSQYQGWMNAGRLTVTPGNVIDFGWIEADLIDFVSRHSVQAVAFDPFQATQLGKKVV